MKNLIPIFILSFIAPFAVTAQGSSEFWAIKKKSEIVNGYITDRLFELALPDFDEDDFNPRYSDFFDSNNATIINVKKYYIENYFWGGLKKNLKNLQVKEYQDGKLTSIVNILYNNNISDTNVYKKYYYQSDDLIISCVNNLENRDSIVWYFSKNLLIDSSVKNNNILTLYYYNENNILTKVNRIKNYDTIYVELLRRKIDTITKVGNEFVNIGINDLDILNNPDSIEEIKIVKYDNNFKRRNSKLNFNINESNLNLKSNIYYASDYVISTILRGKFLNSYPSEVGDINYVLLPISKYVFYLDENRLKIFYDINYLYNSATGKAENVRINKYKNKNYYILVNIFPPDKKYRIYGIQ